MNMFWFGPRSPKLTQEQQQRLDDIPNPAPLDAVPLAHQRLVVVDLETTGLNLKRDQVISIGAVVIDANSIDFGQMFERTLLREPTEVSESVLIHGIAPSALAAGDDPAEVLLDFMEFVGDSPLLAYHAGFDQRMLARALRESLGYRLNHPFFDVAEIAPLLRPDANLPKAGLDDWVKHFGLQVHQRHHASADALVTAELGLILFNLARRQGVENLGQLDKRLANWRRRQQMHHSM